MKSRTWTCITAITFFAALVVPIWLSAQEQQREHIQIRYAVIDLGLAADQVGGINDKGGLDYTAIRPDGSWHATFWRSGIKADVGTLGGPNSSTFFGPSERGQVVGKAETSTPDPLGEDFCLYGTGLVCRGFVWQNGVMTPLSTLGGNNSWAADINNHNQVVGFAENTSPDPACPPPQVLQSLPVIWKNGEIHELPTISGDSDGYAFSVNDHGQAVGTSGNCTTLLHAVLWLEDSQAKDLGSLGGSINNFAQSINNHGQVVGFSDLAGDIINDAFLWAENQGMQDLGTLPGDIGSGAWAINDNGQIVGLGSRAILWLDGALTDLNTLVPGPPFSPLYLLSAYDINARGEIVGLGLAKTGAFHAFLAMPSDERHSGAKACEGDAGGSTVDTSSDAASLTDNPSSLAADRVPPTRKQVGGVLGRFPAGHFSGRYFPNHGNWTTRQP